MTQASQGPRTTRRPGWCWRPSWSGTPSHAYLFHGPRGHRQEHRRARLRRRALAEGSDDPESVRRRVANGTHPDLTWVRPTRRPRDARGGRGGAGGERGHPHAVRVAKRRVFVLERVDTMNDEVANRLLKTLEEPAHFVHVILLTEALGRVLDTVISRCQLVRFDPLPAARIAAVLEAEGVPAETALACAGLLTRQRHARPLPRVRGGPRAARGGGPVRGRAR